MYRASDIIQNTRLEKDLTIEEISKKIKIPSKYLSAFEKEDKDNFPQEPYCSLILKDYANFLGLNGERILMIFRRDFEIKNKTIPKKTKKNIYFSPQLTFSISLIFVFIIFATYLLNEYLKFNRPPKVKVDWPQDFTNPLIIQGYTDPINTIRVNDDLILVEKDGQFIKKVKFQEEDEEKKVSIEVVSPAGKISKDEKIYK
jgi:transcriptional regulator with XRE-family HTH domain